MKKNLLAFFIILFTTLGNAQISQTGLVTYYPFSGNPNDSSSNGFNGTLGGQTLDSGICGTGYYFTYNSINCGDPPGNEFDIVNDASISLWFKLYSYPSPYYTLIGKDVSAGNNVKKWFIAVQNNSISFHINGPGMGSGY